MKRFLAVLPLLLTPWLASISNASDRLWLLGDNSWGQTNFAINPSLILQISCGREHVVTLRRDGTISAWGIEGDGRTSPPSISNVISVAAGSYHSLALLRDGTVKGWGYNGAGLLDIPATASNVVQIAVGSFHSLALRRDGTIVGWGHNGQKRAVPPEGLSGVVTIAAGRDHSVALKRNGQAVCWGLNDAGQCNVPAEPNQFIGISAGDFHTLALSRDGKVLAWGENQDGQCSVPQGLDHVIAIAAGHRHSVALKSDGTVVAWGSNKSAQSAIPPSVRGVIAISASGLNTALLETDQARISSQPLSRTSLAGRDVEFEVTTSGPGPFRYQWFLNGSPIIGSGRMAGLDQSKLTLTGIQRRDAGLYSVDVYDGDRLQRSASALLVVRSLVQMEPPVFNDGIPRISFSDQEGEVLLSSDAALYQMQWSSNLSDWLNLNAPIVAEFGKLFGTDEASVHKGSRFYRLVPKI